jgi:hypothetical protein
VHPLAAAFHDELVDDGGGVESVEAEVIQDQDLEADESA